MGGLVNQLVREMRAIAVDADLDGNERLLALSGSRGRMIRAEVMGAHQPAAVAVTATADGLLTGLIPATARFVAITSANADHIVTLPAAVVGHVLQAYVGANGCEVRTPAASGAKINDVDSDGTNEAAIVATTMLRFTCTAADTWNMQAFSKLGAVLTAIVPDTA